MPMNICSKLIQVNPNSGFFVIMISNSDIQSDDGPDDDNNEIEMFCGEEERVPDSVSGASDGESQDDYDLMESDLDEDYSDLSAFCM